MHVRLRRAGLVGAVALGSAGVLLATALPASAVTVPDWPTSRVPAGCQPNSVMQTDKTVAFTYNDDIVPSVTGWTYNGSRTRLVRKPGSSTFTFSVGVQQTCSGVRNVTVRARQSLNGGPAIVNQLPLAPFTSDVFAGPWGLTGPSDPTSSTGWLEILSVQTAPRYSQFALDESFALTSKTDNAGAATELTGPWSTQRLYVVLSTTQSTSQSKTTVAAGGSVTLRTTVKVLSPDGLSYVAAPGLPVKLQTKIGTGSWTTRATRTTGSTGAASYTYKPSKTMQWRWVLAENITVTPYYAKSFSTARTIKVT